MKKRLDVILLEKGLSESRERAKTVIMEGCVYVNNQKSDKPGMTYNEDCNIEIRQNKIPFVSRGGLKLDKAIKNFSINLEGLIALDSGASTGGFTDCMLKNGCKKIYAVDVGYGQLDWKIRSDSRVINLERTNIRYINKDIINDDVKFFSLDLSFISLCKVLPAVREIVSDLCKGVCLIKPQFEAGKDKVGKNGVIRDPKTRVDTINKVINFCLNNGFSILNLDYSPIRGPKGNIEYLLYIEKSDNPTISDKIKVEEVELKSREEFNSKGE